MDADAPVAPRPLPGAQEFTTRIYPEREGFAFWQDEICRHLSPSLTERADPAAAFAASLKRVAIGHMGVCDISFSPMRNLRDARCVRRMPDDDVFVAAMKAGTGHLQHCGRSVALTSGDVVLYHSARPFEWRFAADTRMVVARLNRRHLQARLFEFDSLSARLIPAAHPAASIIGNTLGDLVRLEASLAPEGALRFGDALVDLIAASVEACLSPPEPRAADADLLRRCQAHLIDNMDDPDLDLERLAGHFGVSVRTLGRAFAAQGTTPIRWLWHQRLAAAARLLRDGRPHQVGQVAMLCGFSDFSHFSRSFRKAYGTSPKAVLQAARAR